MKPSNEDKLLRRTLQDIYSDYPLPSQNDWEQEVMRKIGVMPVPHEEKKARRRTYIGWWAAASAVAAVGLLLLTVTFWPQPNTPAKRQHVVARTDTNKQSAASPIDITSAPHEEVCVTRPKNTSTQHSAPKGKPQVTVQTTPGSQRLAKVSPTQAQEANAESAQKTHTEALPPYERPLLQRPPHPTKKKPILVTEEALLRMNDFSLAAYDKLMGIEVGQPKPEKPFAPAAEPTLVRVSQRMAATPMTALSQDLQSKELAFSGTSKRILTSQKHIAK